MSDIICKNYNENDCKRLNPNCKWAGKRGCIRRDGVLGGIRYRYNEHGEAVVLEDKVNEHLLDVQPAPFEFIYSPDNFEGKTFPSITRKFISTGTYGAAFVPAFPCQNGQTYEKYVGKVFFDKPEADIEWRLAKLLKEFESGTSQRYFTYPKYQCEIDFKCPANGNELSQLSRAERELFDVFNKKILAFYQGPIKYPRFLIQHIMDYSGYTLSGYMKKYYNNQNFSRAEFIHIIENLFYAVKRLNDLGYVHQDIKTPNVVISNSKRLRVIDFGMTISIDDYSDQSKNFLLRTPYHSVSPPENYLFDALYWDETITYRDIIGSTFSDDKTTISWYDHLESSGNKLQTDELIKTLISIQKDVKMEDRRKVLTKFWKDNRLAYKADTYSIGTTILWILRSNVLLRSANDNPESVILFKQLMGGLLAINPLHRLDINQAIKLVKQIKAIPHDDPFKRNVDPPEVKNIFLQFGKVNQITKLNKDINYLKK